MNVLVTIGIAPVSWRLGVVRHTTYKWVFAMGPLRFSIHKLQN